MKSKIIYLSLLICGISSLISCSQFDWDVDNNTTLSSFDITSDALSVTIISGEEENNLNEFHTLTWNKSKAEDYSLVFYTVNFAATNEFSKTVYSMETARLGSDNFLNLSYNTLNIIAERAGIKPGDTGQVYWKVIASNGIADAQSNNIGTITITRPAGFAYIPENIYLMGTSTQAGNEVGEAILMHKFQDKEGVFEIITYLTEGDFYFIEKVSKEDYRQFSISGKTFSENEGKSSPVSADQMHRLVLDFNDASASISKLSEVALWFGATNSVKTGFSQSDKSVPVWNLTFTLDPEDTGYNYKFRVKEEFADGSQEYVYWGYHSKYADYQKPTTSADYFYLYEVDDSRTDNYYRFNNEGLHADKTLTITLDMQPEEEYYKHSVEVKE